MVGQPRQSADTEARSDPTGDLPHQASLARGDFLVGGAVALVALVIYVLTLAPGLLRADSGELQTLAVTLGYAHPTGYPVLLLLAKTATAIPVGDVAYRVNLLSAVMGAVAVGLLYLLGRLATGRRWIPVAGALALALSPTFWSQAIIAEVYTSGVVCTVGVLLGLVGWQQTGRVRWLFAAACLGGVSLGVHAAVVLMAPAAVLLVALTPRRWKANAAAAVSGAVTGVAITLAAFAVINLADGPTSYFNTVIYPSRSLWQLDEDDLDGFLDRVRLSMDPPQFRGLLFSQSPKKTWEKTIDYSNNLRREFPPLWLVAAGAGLVWLGRRNWKITLLLALTYATHLGYGLNYAGVVHVMYIATYVPIAVFGVAGLALASDAAAALVRRLGKRQRSPETIDLMTAMVGLIVVTWPLMFAGAWNREGRRACWVPPEERDAPQGVAYSVSFHQQVRELIDGLEEGAVVFTGWCLVYPYYYVAHVEQDRTDLVFLQDYHHADQTALADSAVEYIKHIKSVSPDRPVYLSHAKNKMKSLFQIEAVRRGPAILYRVGKPRQKEKGT